MPALPPLTGAVFEPDAVVFLRTAFQRPLRVLDAARAVLALWERVRHVTKLGVNVFWLPS